MSDKDTIALPAGGGGRQGGGQLRDPTTTDVWHPRPTNVPPPRPTRGGGGGGYWTPTHPPKYHRQMPYHRQNALTRALSADPNSPHNGLPYGGGGRLDPPPSGRVGHTPHRLRGAVAFRAPRAAPAPQALHPRPLHQSVPLNSMITSLTRVGKTRDAVQPIPPTVAFACGRRHQRRPGHTLPPPHRPRGGGCNGCPRPITRGPSHCTPHQTPAARVQGVRPHWRGGYAEVLRGSVGALPLFTAATQEPLPLKGTCQRGEAEGQCALVCAQPHGGDHARPAPCTAVVRPILSPPPPPPGAACAQAAQPPLMRHKAPGTTHVAAQGVPTVLHGWCRRGGGGGTLACVEGEACVSLPHRLCLVAWCPDR